MWLPGNYNHRSVLTRLLRQILMLFSINANSEASFIEVVRQLDMLHYKDKFTVSIGQRPIPLSSARPFEQWPNRGKYAAD